MYDARAIANFFLDQASMGQRSLSSMSLLKVLYFAHAWYLVKYDKALIAQPFEAWKHGPVNRVVYDQIKGLGSKPVCDKLVSFSVKDRGFRVTDYSLNAGQAAFLSDIFQYYSQFHAFALSDLTHERGSPWDKVWTKAETQSVPGMIIPNELIAQWFKESSQRQSHPLS